MDGVTILNTFEESIRITGDFNDIAAVTAFIISVIVAALIGLSIGCANDDASLGLLGGIMCGIIAGFFIGAMSGVILAEPDTYETITRYEVVLDANVSMNEFCDKYQIVEQRGDIFVVEEKQ